MKRNCLSFIQIDKKKGLLGVVLGSLAFVLMKHEEILPAYRCVFFAMFVIAGFLRLGNGDKRLDMVLCTLWTAACLIVISVFPYANTFAYDAKTMMMEHSAYLTFPKNWLLIFVGYLLLYVLLGNWKLSVIGITGALGILTIANGYVLRFRGKLLLFTDLFAFKTAMNVAGQYDLSLGSLTIYFIALILLLFFCAWAFRASRPAGKWRLRLGALVTALVMALVFGVSTRHDSTDMWYWNGVLTNGYYHNFYLSFLDTFVEKPEQYSTDAVLELESQYPDETAVDSPHPDIVVIMNESFADLRIFGSELRTNVPVTPFLDSLEENTIRGNVLASVYGGTTANSEFEFLTGFSTQFLPQGAMPYRQFVTKNTYSLVWALKEQGYQCFATHPYASSGWDRTKAYPYLGFDDATFIEDYPQEDLVRAYVSDREMYAYILDRLDSGKAEPQFIFGITMQNHGGYEPTEENYVHTIELQDYSRDYPEAEVYLTLTNYSDDAVKYFFGELEKREKDTIVLFFGDHLPTMETAFLEELYGGGFHTLDDKMLQYTVPFYIWANYDIEEKTVGCTSLNYLSCYLLEAAGIRLPPYFQFLKDAEAVIPSVNAHGYYSEELQSYQTADNARGQEQEWLEKYRTLQYNGIFDKKNLSRHFFGKYMN